MLNAARWRALLTVILLVSLTGCGGSVVSKEFLSNGDRDFDFRQPGCASPSAAPDRAVEVRYLGSGGAAIRWNGQTILLGPYFSHAGGVLRAQFGRLDFQHERIEQGMRGIDPSSIRALLIGHSHFDHIGDVPVIARDYARDATIWVNQAGANMLAAYETLRVGVVEQHAGSWVEVHGKNGEPVFRFMAVASEHAPQVCRGSRWPCVFAKCPIDTPWTTPWETRRLKDLCGGTAHAFVIDLLDSDGQPVYRIYYNDTASPPDKGIPPTALNHERDYDLAIVCMPSFDLVDDYPDNLLRSIAPRHVLISHYDDMFARQKGEAWRFVPLLGNPKATAFMRRLDQATSGGKTSPRPPVNSVCGPATDRWSMPVPQWTLFFAPERRTR